MQFNSFNFLFFFPIAIFFYYTAPKKIRWVTTILFSGIFLLFGGITSLIVLLGESILNYYAGLLLNKFKFKSYRRSIFWFVLLINIGILAYFKYIGFIVENFLAMLHIVGLSFKFNWSSVILPLGISFYTFQAISYLIDVYRGSIKVESHFGYFLNYMLFYPKLIAGPVERANTFLSQSKKVIDFHVINLYEGMQRILWGFFKKLVIADRLAIYTGSIFEGYLHHNGTTLFFGSFLYIFQLYTDFSGYTDIALGISKTMGIDLMENFKFPLYSTSVTEFWRRWHISLSSWANDYIFTPFTLQYRDWGRIGFVSGLFLTFFMIGIWHGPTWGFALFGTAQGVLIIFELLTKRFRKQIFKIIPKILKNFFSILLTMLFFTLSCVFFNFASLEQSSYVFTKIFFDHGTLNFMNQSQLIFSIFGILVLLFTELFLIKRDTESFYNPKSKWILNIFWNIILVILILTIGVFDGGQFIYFAF